MVGSPSTSPRLHLRPPLLLNHRPLLLRRWRSAAAPCASLLLLSPLHRFLKWAFLGRCHLQTLTHTGDTEPYRSLVSPGTLSKPCIGRSNYPLIFVTSSFAILGRRVHRRPGQISQLPCHRILRGFFARNPHGTAATVIVIFLLLFGSSDGSECCLSCILYPVLGTTSSEWSVLELEKFQMIVCLVAFKGQVFGLDPHRRHMAVEFVPNMSWRLLEVQPPPEILDEYHYLPPLPHKTHTHTHTHTKKKKNRLSSLVYIPTLLVYKLDLENSMWVEKEDLGDWCSFVDAVGRCGFSCKNPSRWGGRNNSTYIARRGCEG